MKKILLHILYGIASGCTIFVFLSLVGIALVGENFLPISSSAYIKQVLSSMVVGIGFSLPSLIYKADSQRPSLRQVVFHLGIGFAVYLLAACYAGWIPLEHGLLPALFSIFIGIALMMLIWAAFYFYHYQEAKTITKKISEKNRQWK